MVTIDPMQSDLLIRGKCQAVTTNIKNPSSEAMVFVSLPRVVKTHLNHLRLYRALQIPTSRERLSLRAQWKIFAR